MIFVKFQDLSIEKVIDKADFARFDISDGFIGG